MIVEHAFISTRDADQTLAAAGAVLTAMGFQRAGVMDPLKESRPCPNCQYDLKGLPMQSPCPECGVQSAFARRIEFAGGASRGRGSAFKIETHPCRVFVEYDRGKVTVAASVTPNGKADPLHEKMLLTLAGTLEKNLVRPGDADGASLSPGVVNIEEWQALKEDFRRFQRRKQLPVVIVAVAFVVILGGGILLAVVLAR